MKKYIKIITLLLISLQSQNVLAQNLYEKKIVDSEGKGIPYVNIGIFGTINGTVSDEEGTFKLTVSEANEKDTVLISALGYKNVRFGLNDFISLDDEIVLMKEVLELEEITVVPRRLKKKNYGQERGNKNISRATVYKKGNEDAVLIEPGKYPFRIEKASVRISFTKQKEYSFRVRLYKVDEQSGGPGEEITRKNYILTSSRKKGFVEYSFLGEDLWIEEPIYLSFEWLITKEYEEETFAILDSIRVVRNEIDELPEEERAEKYGLISELSLQLPTTFYMISNKPKTHHIAGISF